MNDYRRFLTFVFLLMISGSAALAQELMKVAGLVVDQNADPLIGVTVRVQGDNKGGTVTDMDGNFTIQVQKGKTLVFSYLGYKNKEILANSSKGVSWDFSNSTFGFQDKHMLLPIPLKERELNPNIQQNTGW